MCHAGLCIVLQEVEGELHFATAKTSKDIEELEVRWWRMQQ